MRNQGDLSGQDTEVAQTNQSNMLNVPTEDVVHINCGARTFHLNLASIQEQTGVFEIQPGVACGYLLSADKLVLETECVDEIIITGRASGLRYLYISSKGTLVFGLDINHDNLRFRFDASNVYIETKLVTQAAGGIFIHDDEHGKIVFNQDCDINILLLSAPELQLNNANIDAAKTYIEVDSLKSSGNSSLVIGYENASDLSGLEEIVPPNIAQVITSQSYIGIKNSTGTCNFDVVDAECHFEMLANSGDLHFYRSVVWYAGTLAKEYNTQFVLYDSTLHGKGLDIAGDLDVLESDVYVEDKILLDCQSNLKLYGALICGGNVQIKGKVEYLDNNPSNPFNTIKSESRIVSSNDFFEHTFENKNKQQQTIRVKHHTARHTSLKQLRDFVESKTSPINEQHLRVLSVPGDGDCVLYSLVVNLLYLGMVHDVRAKVVDVLSYMYEKHELEVLQSNAYVNVNNEQFNAFASEYIQANYYGQFSDFINKYFESNSKDFVVTSFLAACARLAVRAHSAPQINKIYDVNNAHARFSAEEKQLRHYPELLAVAKQELAQSLSEAMLEFTPHQFINIEYVQSYANSIGLNSVVKYKSGIAPLSFNNNKNKFSITFWVSGNNDLNRHYEPELNLQLLNSIKFGASIPKDRGEDADILLDMLTIMCYYTPGAINVFGAEYAAKIQAKTLEIFESEHNVERDGCLVVHDTANISGVNGHLYSTGPLLVQGKIVVNNHSVMSSAIKVTSTGVIDGGKSLKLQSSSMTKNHGKILSDETQIICDYFISTNQAYIAGKNHLDIQSLVHVLNLSYLYTISGNINAVFNINSGVMHVWNCQVDTLINLDGVTIPCLPRSASDLCDRGKLFTLFKMGLGVLSAEAALALQVGTRAYGLAQTTKQMYALYGKLKDKNWRDFSRHDTAALLMQIKRTVNEAYGAYRIAPSVAQLSQAKNNVATTVQSSNTFQNAKTLVSDFKQNGLRTFKDIKNNEALNRLASGVKDDLRASMVASKSKLGDFCSQQIATAGNAIAASQATVKQAWQDKDDLRTKLAEQGKWLPRKADIPIGSALKDVVDATRDVAALVLPYKHSDSILDVRYGLQATFSNTSQSFWGFDGPLYSINGNEYNQRLFTQYNSKYSMHKSYDYHTTCGLDYINYGTVDTVNWHVSARDYVEHGTTDAPCKIFDIRGNAHVTRGGKVTGMGDISGTIGGDLIIDGITELGARYLKVGGKIRFTNTSDITTDDVAFFAQSLSHLGNWHYSGNLYVEVEHVESTLESIMRGAVDSVATFKAKTEDLSDSGEHFQIFYDIEQMDAVRARNLAYQQENFANVTAAKSIKVTTQSKDNIAYAGLRKDSAIAELVTGGGVTLDPVTYDRARGKVFANYNEAASVAANYASYNIPPPPPPSKRKRFWRKVFKEVVKVLEGIGAVVGSASAPQALVAGSAIAGVAAGVDQLIKYGERKDNRRMEEGNRRVLEGQQVVNRAILAANQQSASLALVESHAHQNAQVLASGGRMNNAYRQASQQQISEQQQQLNQEFANQSHDLEQMHNQDLYDLRTQNDAIRKRISHSGGPKIGFGTAVNSGSTGTSINLTTTIGSQNPVTSRVEVHSFDSGRLRNQQQKNSEQARAPKLPLPPIVDTHNQDTLDAPRSNTQVFMLDELGNELRLEPMEDSGERRLSRPRRVANRRQQSVLDDTSYLTTPAFRTGRPVLEDVADDAVRVERAGKQLGAQNTQAPRPHPNAYKKTVVNPRSTKPLINKKPDMEINLQETIANKLLIGAGRMFVETGQGVIQLAMQGGELIGVVEPEALDAYNDKIRAEHNLYSSTPVANSTAGKVGEFTGGLLLFSVIPGGVAARGYKLALSGAASGAVVTGLQPVYEGNLTQRGINSLVGATTGAILAPTMAKAFEVSGQAIVRLFSFKNSVAKYAQGNGVNLAYGGGNAANNIVFTPRYASEKDIVKAIKVEGGSKWAPKDQVLKEVGHMLCEDPVAYLSYKRLQAQGTKVIFDFESSGTALSRGYFDRYNNVIKIHVKSNSNSREVVSTLIHEAHHQRTCFNRKGITNIYEEYKAFRREFIFEQGRRPNICEKNNIWDWVFSKYSKESAYLDRNGNVKLGFSENSIPDFIKSKLPKTGVSFTYE